jgi:hypothetical protein
MKKMLILFYLLPTICIAQIVKTKTMYKAYSKGNMPVAPIAEEIKTYDNVGQIIQIITMGMVDTRLSQLDTVSISSSIGKDSMVVINKDELNYNKPASKEILTYANNQVSTNTITNYFHINTKLDSSIETNSYQYFPLQKVIKTTMANNVQTTNQYRQDANGIKIADRYIVVFDKGNRLKEKYAKAEDKKTARIEKYNYYNTGGHRKDFSVWQGKKLKSITKYIYDKESNLILEKTKNMQSKKITYDSISYEYTNGNCTKEITHTDDEIDSVVEYSYTFY